MRFEEVQSQFGLRAVLKQFIRNSDGTRRGLMLGFRDHKDQIYVGWSLCHPHLDKFDEETGIRIAYDRAFTPNSRKMKVPKEITREVANFCWRCHDYFKECEFSPRVDSWIGE